MSPHNSSTVNSEIKSALRSVIIAVFVICAVCAGGDFMQDTANDIRTSQEQTERYNAIIAELNTPEGQKEAQRQIDVQEELLRITSIQQDPQYMTRLLPCVQWPAGYQDMCAANGGDTEWTPPPAKPVKEESAADRECGRLPRGDMMNCYGRYGE